MHTDTLADRFTDFSTVLARVLDVMQYGLISLHSFVHYSTTLSTAASPLSKLSISQFWNSSNLCFLGGAKAIICDPFNLQALPGYPTTTTSVAFRLEGPNRAS